MSFASLEYLPFLFATLAIFQFVPVRARIGFLCLASLLYCLAGPAWHVFVLLLATAASFTLTLRIGGASDARARKRWLIAAIVAQLGLLAFFRYAPQALDALHPAADGERAAWIDALRASVPLGLSFYALQHIGYAVDVHRRKLTACNEPLRYLLFGSFFPQLSSGPIERGGHLLPQLGALKLLNVADVSIGVRRILWGLLKKLVLADVLSSLARPIFERPEGFSPPQVALAALALFVVLYADFSAYTDIARGSARLFGIELVPNFDRPFLARSIFEFMRRWHMSLMSWVTDYIYSPLLRPPVTRARLWRANLIVMGALGVWHGAAPKFLVAGATFGVLLSLHQMREFALARSRPRGARRQPSRASNVAGWCAMLFSTTAITSCFFVRDLEHLGQLAVALVPSSWTHAFALAQHDLLLAALLAGAFALHALGAVRDLESLWTRVGKPGQLAFCAVLIASIVAFGARNAEPFLYFQF